MKSRRTLIAATPPEPTLLNPYAQLDWLFERFARRYKNEESKEVLRNTVRAFKRFLRATAGYDERLAEDPRFYLSVHCHPFVLYDIYEYWSDLGYASHTRATRLASLRTLLNFAAEKGLTPTSVFFFPRLEQGKRETLHREAYETKELELIWCSFSPIFDYARRVAAGYKPTGVGSDPRRESCGKHPSRGEAQGAHSGASAGWSWENFVWYFENEMKCRPVVADKQGYAMHGKFFAAAVAHYGSVIEVWRRLGVAPLIDVNLITPLAMKLCWETGLNTGSLLSLKRDCFREQHPLTGQPYLLYYKERSSGEKQLHLNLLDTPGQAQMPLWRKQSQVIRRTVELILKLTEPLVSEAKESDKDLLFIYQAQKSLINSKPPGSVIRLRSANIARWGKPLLQKLKDAGHEHVPVYLNLARFRPSRITQMVRDGKDFFDIQAAAGHARLHTTLKYLSAHQLAPQARREVSAALQRIHENREEFESNPMPYATAETQRAENVIYKGVLCDCKNVYDPPESVRRLKTYKPGQPCTYFNMCLRCPNVVVTKRHLPLLVNYKREVERSTSGGNLMNVPNSASYEHDLAILDGIMLEFDQADVAWAQETAECADGFFDPVTYRAVDER